MREIPGDTHNEQRPTSSNRIVELIQKDLIGKELLRHQEGSRRGEMLKWKNLILKSLLLGSLAEQYYGPDFDLGSVTEEGGGPVMHDPDFIKFANSVSKESLLLMLEKKRQKHETYLASLEPKTEEYMGAVHYIDAVEELMQDLDR